MIEQKYHRQVDALHGMQSGSLAVVKSSKSIAAVLHELLRRARIEIEAIDPAYYNPKWAKAFGVAQYAYDETAVIFQDIEVTRKEIAVKTRSIRRRLHSASSYRVEKVTESQIASEACSVNRLLEIQMGRVLLIDSKIFREVEAISIIMDEIEEAKKG